MPISTLQLVIPETEKQRVKAEMLACSITARQQREAHNLMFEGGLEWLGLEEGGQVPPLMGTRLHCVRVVDVHWRWPWLRQRAGAGGYCGGCGRGGHEEYGGARAHP